MKKFIKLACAVLLLATPICASGCGAKTSEGQYEEFSYVHYASGGIKSNLKAVILYENANNTFTRYQVGFVSCTCRDAASNYSSVMYIELLNNKDVASKAAIRQISFSNANGYGVGFWGDSNPVHGQPTYTAEYMDTNFVQKLVGLTKADIDTWTGYGTQVKTVDADAVTGASVSTSNITSVIKGLFEYHAEKYYK